MKFAYGATSLCHENSVPGESWLWPPSKGTCGFSLDELR